MNKIQRIGFVGSGNVATQLAQTLHQYNKSIPVIINRSINHAQQLADKVGAKTSTEFDSLNEIDLDLLILAVNDQNIESVSHELKNFNIPIVHTSGATSKNVMSNHKTSYGVFYPLQTMLKSEEVDFSGIPLCIDANNKDFLDALENLAGLISNKVYKVSDEQRQFLHLSAVILNNNVNHLLAKVNDILVDKKLPKEILEPLLKKTIDKSSKHHPKELQTGPARRNDINTKSIHLDLIDQIEDEQLKHLYNVFWESIQSYYK